MPKEKFFNYNGTTYKEENGKVYFYKKFVNCFNVDFSRYVEVQDPRPIQLELPLEVEDD